MANLADLYQVLGVSRDASHDEVRNGYKEAAKRSHPDMPGGSHERFLLVGFAERLLLDPSHRAKYDLVLALQDALQHSSSPSVVVEAMSRAEAALAGWRCPPELTDGIVSVVESAQQWVRRNSSNSAADQSGAYRPRGGPFDHSRYWSDLVAPTRARVIEDMKAWPALLRRLDSAIAGKDRRQRLRDLYRVYSALRRAQDVFRYEPATDADVRFYFHTCVAVREVAEVVRQRSAAEGVSYAIKNSTWLTGQVKAAQRRLRDQGVEAGEAPWARPQRTSSGTPPTDRPDPAAGKSGGEAEPRASAASRAEPAAGDVRPGRGARVAAWVSVAVLAIGLLVIAFGRDSGEGRLRFEGSIKQTQVECSSRVPVGETERQIGFFLDCELLDTRPGNEDRPYVEVSVAGCDRIRLDGVDEAWSVRREAFIEPCSLPISQLDWRICQTRGGPLPDDCMWNSLKP